MLCVVFPYCTFVRTPATVILDIMMTVFQKNYRVQLVRSWSKMLQVNEVVKFTDLPQGKSGLCERGSG